MNAREERRALAAGKVWRAFGERFGWRLYGWSDEFSATFQTATDGSFVEFQKHEREAVERAIAGIAPLPWPGSEVEPPLPDHIEKILADWRARDAAERGSVDECVPAFTPRGATDEI